MGAKQSKRSVDISGKEAESAGEVAAAGAGGEGRVEALADADALKPQANGAAHIHEQTDKEKQLDSGTPENEKDATTEKEAKEEVTNEEDVPVTNGDTGDKPDDGDSAPAPEDTKKPKKEKVKKKWSLRSISFSRKDKPKQEKKHKEEEPKTNGEPEKVPEEAAEVTAENATKEVAEEFKPEAVKEEKTPETPVTEPLTNGSSTPESPKVESPAADEPPAAAPAPTPAPETDRPELKAEVQPEQLPVNGLSLEEQKPDAPEAQNEESKPEEPATDTTETAPAPEIPVKKEVCVEQMSLESTPPPLPANPPPSSVASFAATTMAPELTDASLANTAELVISTPPAPTAGESTLDAVAPSLLVSAEISDNNIATAATELPPPLKESSDGKPAEIDTVSVEPQIDETIHAQTIESQLEIPEVQEIEPEVQNIEPEVQKIETEVQKLEPEVQKIEPDVQKVETEVHTLEPEVEKAEPEIEQAEKIETLPVENVEPKTEEVEKEIENAEPPLAMKMEPIVESETDAGDSNIEKVEKCKSSPMTAAGDISPCPESNVDTFKTISEEIIPQDGAVVEECSIAMKLESPEVEMPPAPIPDDLEIPELSAGLPETIEDLPPPPPIEEEVPAVETFFEEKTVAVEDNAHETKVNSNHILENTEIKLLNTENLNGNVDTEQENLKNKTKDSLGNVIKTVECNGNSSEESRRGEAMDVSPSEPGQPAPAAAAAPPPAADMPQEPIPVSDKLADLIPEVPVVPELNTQTETSSDVAVAN